MNPLRELLVNLKSVPPDKLSSIQDSAGWKALYAALMEYAQRCQPDITYANLNMLSCIVLSAYMMGRDSAKRTLNFVVADLTTQPTTQPTAPEEQAE